MYTSIGKSSLRIKGLGRVHDQRVNSPRRNEFQISMHQIAKPQAV